MFDCFPSQTLFSWFLIVTPDIIIKYISLSLLRSCFVLRYTLDFSIGARALSTEAQVEE